MKIRLPLKITQLSTLTLLHLCCSGALHAAPADDWGDWALDNERFIVQPGENDLLIERGGDIQALDAQEQAIFQALDNSQLSDYPADASTEMEDDRETFLQQLEDLERAHAADLDGDIPEPAYSTDMPMGVPVSGAVATEGDDVIVLEAGEVPATALADEGMPTVTPDGVYIDISGDVPLEVLEDLPLDELDSETLQELQTELQEQFPGDVIIIEDGFEVIDGTDTLDAENGMYEAIPENELENGLDAGFEPGVESEFEAGLETDIAEEMDL